MSFFNDPSFSYPASTDKMKSLSNFLRSLTFRWRFMKGPTKRQTSEETIPIDTSTSDLQGMDLSNNAITQRNRLFLWRMHNETEHYKWKSKTNSFKRKSRVRKPNKRYRSNVDELMKFDFRNDFLSPLSVSMVDETHISDTSESSQQVPVHTGLAVDHEQPLTNCNSSAPIRTKCRCVCNPCGTRHNGVQIYVGGVECQKSLCSQNCLVLRIGDALPNNTGFQVEHCECCSRKLNRTRPETQTRPVHDVRDVSTPCPPSAIIREQNCPCQMRPSSSMQMPSIACPRAGTPVLDGDWLKQRIKQPSVENKYGTQQKNETGVQPLKADYRGLRWPSNQEQYSSRVSNYADVRPSPSFVDRRKPEPEDAERPCYFCFRKRKLPVPESPPPVEYPVAATSVPPPPNRFPTPVHQEFKQPTIMPCSPTCCQEYAVDPLQWDVCQCCNPIPKIQTCACKVQPHSDMQTFGQLTIIQVHSADSRVIRSCRGILRSQVFYVPLIERVQCRAYNMQYSIGGQQQESALVVVDRETDPCPESCCRGFYTCTQTAAIPVSPGMAEEATWLSIAGTTRRCDPVPRTNDSTVTCKPKGTYMDSRVAVGNVARQCECGSTCTCLSIKERDTVRGTISACDCEPAEGGVRSPTDCHLPIVWRGHDTAPRTTCSPGPEERVASPQAMCCCSCCYDCDASINPISQSLKICCPSQSSVLLSIQLMKCCRCHSPCYTETRGDWADSCGCARCYYVGD